MASTNIQKENVILKGFIGKSDIRVLMNGAKWDFVLKVYQQARDDAKRDGKEHFSDKVHYSRVLKILCMEESEIHRMAKLERQIKKDAFILAGTEASNSRSQIKF